MREHFLLENKEAASSPEAAFILEPKSGLRAQIISFQTLRQLDDFVTNSPAVRVRSLPVLLVATPDTSGGIDEAKACSILRRMAEWYYFTQLNPPPAGTSPVDGSGA